MKDRSLPAEELVEESSASGADLIWNTATLGAWLRWLRLDRGFSIGGLAALSGVAGSEIFQVEAGRQECRIKTLLNLCGALGTSPGWLLDRVTSSNFGEFNQRVLRDSRFAELLSRLGVNDDAEGKQIATSLAAACTLASLLLRSSDPVSRAACAEYPHKEWEKRFISFAARLAPMGESLDRASMLTGLLSSPVAELLNQKLIPGKGIEFAWSPWFVRYPRQIKIG